MHKYEEELEWISTNAVTLDVTTYKSLIDEVLNSKEAATYKYMDNILYIIQKRLDSKSLLNISLNYISNCISSSLRYGYRSNAVNLAYTLNPHLTKQAILSNSKHNFVTKHLLSMKDLSLKEEVLGLRALSSGRTPELIYHNRYIPTKEALSSLPTMMRLSAIESLCDEYYLGYNIFKNIKDNEFRDMMFIASLKHNNRFNKVYDKYKEAKELDVKIKFKIRNRCKNCGDYEATFTTHMAKSAKDLKRFWFSRCMFCQSWSNSNEPEITIMEE